ncbi:hypothetical protein [Brasilonema sp. UFV-L1]|nr:hypothetical protein [Brasilonema sp. UFV-L1]
MMNYKVTQCHCERNAMGEPKPRAAGVAGSNPKDLALGEIASLR